MGSAPAAGQGLPDLPRWSAELSAQPLPAFAPVLAGPGVVVAVQPGVVASYRLTDGRPLWAAEVAPEGPMVADEAHVYVPSGEAVHALEAATGRVAWRLRIGSRVTAPLLAHAGWLIAAAAGELLAVRAADGAVVWRKPFGAIEFRPALDGDVLFAPLADGRLVAIDIQTGTERWQVRIGAACTDVLAVGGRVYLGTSEKRFLALSAASGDEQWAWPLGALARGRAAVDDRHVYFAVLDNTVRAVDRGSGNMRWRKSLLYRPGAGPELVGEAVVAPARDVPALASFRAADGQPLAPVTFPARLAPLPLFASTSDGVSMAIAVTGNLENRWTLSLLIPSPVPPIPVDPLTALPGEAVRLDVFVLPS